MAPFPTDLAIALDGLVQTGRASVTESADDLTVTGLTAADAVATAEAVSALGWTISIEDATPENITVEQISSNYEPYRVVITKPPQHDGIATALTRSGLVDWLRDGGRPAVIWVAGLPSAFETRVNRIAPWGETTAFVPTPTGCDPRKVVRELTSVRLVTAQVDPWLLRDPELEPPVDHWGYATWAKVAFTVLLRSFSDEVEEDGNLLFRGPPLSRLMPEADLVTALGRDGMRAVQRAAAWVFESSVEMRPRHDLFAPEIARTAHTGQGAGATFRLAAGPALEGATMARAFGLSEISRDSLKAMTDLRKAVGEEIGKLSETTRSIAAAVAAALFAGIALIAARLVLDNPALIVRQAAAVIGLVLFLYVAAIIASGWLYVRLQRRLRLEWHSKIYRFMPDADYKAMVIQPAAAAEFGFFAAAWIGGAAAAVLLALVVYTAFAPIPQPSTEASPSMAGSKARIALSGHSPIKAPGPPASNNAAKSKLPAVPPVEKAPTPTKKPQSS